MRQTSTPAKERNEASEDSSEDSGDQSSEGEQVLGDLPEATGGDTVHESSKVLC